MLLLLSALPVLFFGTAFGGTTVWLHSHGSSGEHVHVLATTDPVGSGTLGTRHDHAHRHGAGHRHDHPRGHEHDEHDEPVPAGSSIELPQILAAPTGRPSLGPAASVQVATLIPSVGARPALVERAHRFELCLSGWPPQQATRTGIAALLRSSHAILI